MTYLHMVWLNLKIQAKLNEAQTQESWDTCFLRLKSALGSCCQAKACKLSRQMLTHLSSELLFWLRQTLVLCFVWNWFKVLPLLSKFHVKISVNIENWKVNILLTENNGSAVDSRIWCKWCTLDWQWMASVYSPNRLLLESITLLCGLHRLTSCSYLGLLSQHESFSFQTNRLYYSCLNFILPALQYVGSSSPARDWIWSLSSESTES